MHDNHSKTSDPAVGSTRLGSASPILNIMASPCPGPIFNSVNAAVDAPPIPLHPFLVCGLLCCLMLCECAGDQMAAAGQQQSEYRHARGLNASTAKHAEHNTTESDKHPSPCNSSFQRLKAWLGKKAPPWLTLPVMTLALFSVCYHTAKAIVDRMTRGLKPNARPHWRGASDVRYVNRCSSPRPVQAVVSHLILPLGGALHSWLWPPP
jgi:hypothetical protein